MIDAADEGLHPFGPARHWQESFYFNWADMRHDTIAVTRIGYRFHDRRADGLIFSMRRGRPDFAYARVYTRPAEPWDRMTPEKGFRVKGLRYRMLEPLRRWRLTLEHPRHHMDLEWTATTPAFDYADGNGHGPPEIASDHFEQAGRVQGVTRFHGIELEIDGTGERDKSWGVRDWNHIEGWDWISVQFGPELALNAWAAPYRGERYIGGYVYRNGQNHALTRVDVDYRWFRGRRDWPCAVRMTLADAGGGALVVDGTGRASFPLYFRGLWMEEVFATFTTTLDGRTYDGIGIVEHTYHLSPARALLRTPRSLGTMRRALLG